MKTLSILAATLLPILLALAAGEIWIRSRTEYVTPEILKGRSLEYAPSIFSRHVLVDEERVVPGPNEGQTYRINEFGYRGPDFSWEKPGGVSRILVYGGSAVFDIKVDEGKEWPRRLEEELRRRGHPEVEVINAGVPGHASFDSFGRFLAEGHLLDPDIVVLCNQWNDLKYFKSTQSLLRKMDVYEDDDPRYSYRNGLDRRLCLTSQLYVRLRARYYSRVLDAGEEGRQTSEELRSDYGPMGPHQFALTVSTFVDVVRNAGAAPVLLTQARLLDPGNTPEIRERVRTRYHGLDYPTLLRAFAETDSILEAVAGGKGVVLAEASSRMSGRPEYFADYIHLNEEGALRLAGIVADSIEPLLSVSEKD